jgi:CheY-like chemotaxis protein
MKYGGGGLGLAIAKRLIDRMNGQVNVESTPGSGTIFSFTINFERYKDAEVEDQMIKLLHGIKILVLDPKQSRRRIMRNYFERWDAEVEECGNPADAVKMIHQKAEIRRPYDLVVVEFHIPGTDGLKFASSVKKDPLMQKSKLLLTTSRNEPVTSAELAAAGILVSLVRPYTLSRLKSRIKEVLSQVRKEVSGGADEVELHLKEDQRRVLNILLAEDNVINQKVALVTLQKMGHSIDLAENGKIAVDKFAQKDYDLVLMDLYMPEMDGLEATRKIREFEAMNPGSNPVHICAITANTTAEDEENCYKAGMNSYISKPFKLEELIKILNRI